MGKRLEDIAAAEEELAERRGPRETPERQEAALRSIILDLKNLLARIDHDIPLLQLAITASGESLGTSLPPGVSPSRLLQASTFLIVGDTQYAEATKPVQIGPSFTLSLYMLFLGHASTTSGQANDDPTAVVVDENPPSTPRTQRSPESREKVPYGFGENERKPIWQEVMHKARVRLCRTPIQYVFDPLEGYRPKSGHSTDVAPDYFPTDEFSYHLEIVEDLDDGRVHDDFQPSPYDTVCNAGRRESIPIHHLSKIFYTDTGRILNVGNGTGYDNNPVLLLKRDLAPKVPSRMAERLELYNSLTSSNELLRGEYLNSEESDEQLDIDRQLTIESRRQATRKDEASRGLEKEQWRLPMHLDPEWLALEVFEEDESETSDLDEDSESDQEAQQQPRHERRSLDSSLIDQIRRLSVMSSHGTASQSSSRPVSQNLSVQKASASQESLVARSPFGAIASSLSLMEMLIRLSSLQEFQQMCHLSIPDHILTFFLEETSTTGLTGEDKWNVRNDAKRRVGFDPYTDSPSK